VPGATPTKTIDADAGKEAPKPAAAVATDLLAKLDLPATAPGLSSTQATADDTPTKPAASHSGRAATTARDPASVPAAIAPTPAATDDAGETAARLPKDPAPKDAMPTDRPPAESPKPDVAAPVLPAAADTTRLPGPSAVATVQQAQSPAVAVPQLAATIVAHAKSGESQFTIRMDPPELGRIDVSLSIDDNGTTAATLTVERKDTLDLLQRDSRSLERALTTAGFKSDQGSLQFNLRDPGQNPNAFAGQGQGQDGRGQPQRFVFTGLPEAAADGARVPLQSLSAYGSGLMRLGGLDIKV
jgi:flagellar hook-length control protein FliK